MLKAVFVSSLVVASYATSNRNVLYTGSTKTYVKMNFHCATTGAYDSNPASPTAEGGASDCSINNGTDSDAAGLLASLQLKYGKADHASSPITAVIMVAVMRADGGSEFVDTMNAPGTCVNHTPPDTTAAKLSFFNATDQSFKLQYDSGTDIAKFVIYPKPNCSGVGVAKNSGFKWDETSKNGKRVNGGDTTSGMTAFGHYGVDLNTTAVATDYAEVDALRWINLKHFAGQLVGPYATEKCEGLDPEGAESFSLPIVAPLEVAAGETTEEAFGEPQISTTGKCRNINGNVAGTVAGGAVWYSTELTSTAGEMKVTVSHGTGALINNGNSLTPTCTKGTELHAVTYAVTWDGYFQTCVQAKNDSGTPIAKYYRLIPSVEHIGHWPSTAEAPSDGSTPPASPAALHFSTFMAAFVAFIAAMM